MKKYNPAVKMSENGKLTLDIIEFYQQPNVKKVINKLNSVMKKREQDYEYGDILSFTGRFGYFNKYADEGKTIEYIHLGNNKIVKISSEKVKPHPIYTYWGDINGNFRGKESKFLGLIFPNSLYDYFKEESQTVVLNEYNIKISESEDFKSCDFYYKGKLQGTCNYLHELQRLFKKCTGKKISFCDNSGNIVFIKQDSAE